jgi:hypothetical protein
VYDFEKRLRECKECTLYLSALTETELKALFQMPISAGSKPLNANLEQEEFWGVFSYDKPAVPWEGVTANDLQQRLKKCGFLVK